MSADHLFDRPRLNVETQVSRFDRVNGILVAMLIIVGFFVSLLFLLWLTSVIKFSKRPIQLIVVEGEEGEEKPEGVADDVLEPGVEEFPEVETPQLKDALEAISNALSSVKADMEARDGDAAAMGRGRGLGSRDGGGGGGDGIVPEAKRWKIEYDSNDINVYAKQLSFFKIDIGAVNELNNQITRLADPGGTPRVVRTDRAQESKSLYFNHVSRRLQQWDDKLLKNAGVNTDQAFAVQFYPESTRAILRQIEAAYLAQAKRELKEVRNTFFKVVAEGNGYKFVVTSQVYRR